MHIFPSRNDILYTALIIYLRRVHSFNYAAKLGKPIGHHERFQAG